MISRACTIDPVIGLTAHEEVMRCEECVVDQLQSMKLSIDLEHSLSCLGHFEEDNLLVFFVLKVDSTRTLDIVASRRAELVRERFRYRE